VNNCNCVGWRLITGLVLVDVFRERVRMCVSSCGQAKEKEQLSDGRNGFKLFPLLSCLGHKLYLDIAMATGEVKLFSPHMKSTLLDGDLVTPRA